MTNILNLTKIYMAETFGSMFAKIKKKTSTSSTILGRILFLLIFIFIAANMAVMFWGYTERLQGSNLQNYILYYGMVYFSLLIIVYMSYQAQDLFYKTKDYNLVSSLPIKKHEIIISKFITILLLSYFFEMATLLPAAVIYYIYCPFNFLGLVYLFFAFLFLPILPLFYSALSVYIINLISSKAQKKDKVNMIMLFIFTFIIIGFFIYVNYFGLSNLISLGKVPTALHYIFSTNSFFYYAVNNLNGLYFLYGTLISVGLLALSIFILAKSYLKINQNYQNKMVKSNKELGYEKKSVLQQLLSVEMKSFLSKPIWVFNAAFGMICLGLLAIGFPIYYLINKASVMSTILITPETSFMLFIAIPFALTIMGSTTNSSVSLEGQAIYFKKSLPIKFKDICLSKILLNCIIDTPVILYFLTCAPIVMYAGVNMFEILIALILLVSVVIFTSIFGLVINLFFPKLDWTNVTVVVKQSTSTFIATFGGMGIVMLVYILFYLLNIPLVWFALMATLVFILLCVLLTILLMKKGKKLYEAL